MLGGNESRPSGDVFRPRSLYLHQFSGALNNILPVLQDRKTVCSIQQYKNKGDARYQGINSKIELQSTIKVTVNSSTPCDSPGQAKQEPFLSRAQDAEFKFFQAPKNYRCGTH